MPEFLIQSPDSASSLLFSNKSADHFDVTVEARGLKATKKVSYWDSGPSNDFSSFFQGIASYEKPWDGQKTWEPLEGEIKLCVTCDPLGHVKFKLVLRKGFSRDDNWSLECAVYADFGMLPHLAREARRFAS